MKLNNKFTYFGFVLKFEVEYVQKYLLFLLQTRNLQDRCKGSYQSYLSREHSGPVIKSGLEHIIFRDVSQIVVKKSSSSLHRIIYSCLMVMSLTSLELTRLLK